jgi:glutathione peroxidase
MRMLTMTIAAMVAAAAPAAAQAPKATSAHDFSMTRIDGKPLPLSQFKGKVILVVNTASMCGFTPQYEGLQSLQNRYAKQGFTVIGVPSGDFMGQEYGSNAEIKQFCETKFGINFPMTEKSVVKGAQAAPFYRWAKATLPADNEPKWNFHKFLVGKDGKLIAGFGSKVTPESPEMKRAIEAALAS